MNASGATLEFKSCAIANLVIIRMGEKEIWKILSPGKKQAKDEMAALKKMFKRNKIPVKKYAGDTNVLKLLNSRSRAT